MSGIRIHGLTLAFVLVLATAGGAHSPHWKDFTAHKGMNSKVKHYLDSIKALANAAPTANNEPNYIAPGTKA